MYRCVVVSKYSHVDISCYEVTYSRYYDVALNIGIVGLGFMGNTHLQAYTGMSSAHVIAIASSDVRKRAGDLMASDGNLNRPHTPIDFSKFSQYDNPQSLIADPTVDAVDLCVPTHRHASLAIAALQAGKHVLVEKPMALSARECDEMITASKSAGKVLMVAHVLRYWPEYATARDWIRNEKLGKIHSVSLRRCCACPQWSSWMRDPQKSGGGIFDLLIHDIDYSLQVFGYPEAVSAVGRESLSHGIDIVETRLYYPNGPDVIISGGWQTLGKFPFFMEFTILAERGALHYRSDGYPLTYHNIDGTSKVLEINSADPFQAELQAFTDASISGHPAVDCLPIDSALSTNIALAMCASRQKSGASVDLL